jgi:putative transposase
MKYKILGLITILTQPVAQPAREHMTQDVAAYVKYYNLERLHPSNGDQSPIEYENPFRRVFGWT